MFRDDETAEAPELPPMRPSALRSAARPQFEAAPEADAEPAVGAKSQQNFLRSELDENPISKGSPQSLEALRAEFQRTLASRVDDGFVPPKPERELPGFLKPSRLLLIAIALVAGGTAAFLALQRSPAPEPAPVEIAAPAAVAPVTQVLVAKTGIPVGQRLDATMLEWQTWPDTALRPEYITDAATPEALTGMGDKVARMAFVPGEPIRSEKLGQAGRGYLSSLIQSGMRGVSVTINASSASGGFVVPNDQVDVVLTRTNELGQKTVQTLLTNVRVVAINSQLGESNPAAGGDAVDPQSAMFADSAIATLELDPEASELLINATTMGNLSLVLRPVADASKPATAGQSAANQAIRLTSPFWNPPQVQN
ncbi:MAG: Flp pilus assembly protein CpaB [Hyphomicrobiales bacterium]|nr:MAG: Flp pilus assembly protein CpaB [Hyphomicrobiales bacterium]